MRKRSGALRIPLQELMASLVSIGRDWVALRLKFLPTWPKAFEVKDGRSKLFKLPTDGAAKRTLTSIAEGLWYASREAS